MTEPSQAEPHPGPDATPKAVRDALEQSARVVSSLAEQVRRSGDLQQAAQLERLAERTAEYAHGTRARHGTGQPSPPSGPHVSAPTSAARVLLVDDHELAREALRSVLTAEQGFVVVGEAADGEAAVRLARQVRPDLVLMDVRMPGLDGLAATRAVLAELPETRVIVLTSFEERALVLEALRSGAVGYLLKGASKHEVLDTLRASLAGEHRIQGSLAADLLGEEARGGSPGPLPPLSARELEIVRLMAAGQTNAQIGHALQVSLNTVKTHVLHILRKLDAADRAAAVGRAAALGLLDPGPRAKHIAR